MKTLIATLAIASILATSAIAKSERSRAIPVEPTNSVVCGRIILTDPDPGIRAGFLRDCSHYESPGN
jgi:hypothetical protein